jgi:hypothetical protein
MPGRDARDRAFGKADKGNDGAMSSVRTDVAAILCADLHLSHNPPAARGDENDWYEAQARPLGELKALTDTYQAPVICAGDLFDRANSPPELINFAIAYLPHLYAIPGQHDLLWHDYKQLRKSPFWTLMKAGTVTLLTPEKPIEVGEGGKALRLHGFPWGFELKPLDKPNPMILEVAVVHAYCWRPGKSYPGADIEKGARARSLQLSGYNLAVFGDNHIPFKAPGIFNCGGFQRRKADEKDHRPSIGLLHTDGTVTRYYLDCSKDKLLFDLGGICKPVDVDDFMRELSELGDAAIDFADAVRRHLADKNVRPAVKDIILRSLGGKDGR